MKYNSAVPVTPSIMKMVRNFFFAPLKSATAPRIGLMMAAIKAEMEEV